MDSRERIERLEEMDAMIQALVAIGWSPVRWDPVDEEGEAFYCDVRLRWDGLKQDEEVL